MYKSNNQTEKKKDEKSVFEKKPKTAKASKPKRPTKQEEGLYEKTEDTIKEGGLRKSLKLPKDEKFTVNELSPLLKKEVGEKFKFKGNTFTMTERMKKQIQLAINMIKN